MVETGRDLNNVSPKLLVFNIEKTEDNSKYWLVCGIRTTCYRFYIVCLFFMSRNLLLLLVLSFKTSSAVESSRRLSGDNGFGDWDMIM